MGTTIERLLASLLLMSTPLAAAAPGVPHGRIERTGGSGKLQLLASGSPVRFEVDGLCRYEPGSKRWSNEAFAPIARTLGNGVVADLTDRVGLYWVQWKEDGRRIARMAVAGPVLCNDIHLAPPLRPGVIAACVPLQHSALAAYVPNPDVQCKPWIHPQGDD